MSDNQPQKVYLKDYQPAAFRIIRAVLDVDLHEDFTTVEACLSFNRNPESGAKAAAVFLNGENLDLEQIELDGKKLGDGDFSLTDTGLEFEAPGEAFELKTRVRIEPQNNKALEGLYKSGDIFCTQNESEGFRKITYFLDRPDVLVCFRTTIRADKTKYPVLLSNGNAIDSGELEGGRHFVTWDDPHPKPCYLYALVAGDLALTEDSFKTMSGRTVALRIYTDRGNQDKTAHAMESLKKAMKWDEDTFGLEYDLDVYMIVAVDSFNFGAMENKGLNIFNSQCILADPATATDQNYEYILAVIGHEYFHNWTGNRVTCRDWFQITLKEGLTVFRDHEFSCDMTSRSLRRIETMRGMHDVQFVEDGGPNAHPIRPSSYIEINNFYTSTVYMKGAEVIRMIHTLIGKAAFRKGMEKYFELYDGTAVTTEDFVGAMEAASGMDLTQFKQWYDQAGTPVCEVAGHYDAGKKRFELKVKQLPPPVLRNEPYLVRHFPLAVGLLDPEGNDLFPTRVLPVTSEEQTFAFEGIESGPVPSLLREFSAPVRLVSNLSKKDYIFLLAHDSDAVNRYDAGQRLALGEIARLYHSKAEEGAARPDSEIIEAFGALLKDERAEPAFRAEALVMPSLTALSEEMKCFDFDGLFRIREEFLNTLAREFSGDWERIYEQYADQGPYSAEPAPIGRRSFRNLALAFLVRLNAPEAGPAFRQFEAASNMTDEISALSCLCQTEAPERSRALEAFREKWKANSLVMNKWFAVQALSKCENTLDRVRELEKDSLFDIRNPNKIRSLFTSFTANLARFHAPSGAGYEYIADKILEINAFNPSAAGKLATAFKKYSVLDQDRRARMEPQLLRILNAKDLSKDVYEIISKTLESANSAAGKGG